MDVKNMQIGFLFKFAQHTTVYINHTHTTHTRTHDINHQCATTVN